MNNPNDSQYSGFNSQLGSKQEEKDVADCYYFLSSTCKRGAMCSYRHSPAAKANATLCPQWASTKKCTLDCPMRHSLYHLQKKRSEDFCYFETTEQGCSKPYCEFKHKNPAKDAWKGANISNAAHEEYDLIDHTNKRARNGEADDSSFYKMIEEENRTIDFEIQKVDDEIKRVEEYFQYLR